MLKGLSFDVGQPDRTFQGAIVYVRGTGPGNQLLDLTLDGHGAVASGISVRQASSGRPADRRRNFLDWACWSIRHEFSLRPGLHRRRSRMSTARTCSAGRCRAAQRHLGSVRLAGGDRDRARIKTRNCAWEGLWVGSGTRDTVFEDLNLDDTRIGIYVEHFASDSTFRRVHVGRRSRPASGTIPPGVASRPARTTCSRTRPSRHRARVIRGLLDEGTAHTTVRRSIFVHQRCGVMATTRGSATSGTRRATITAASQRALSRSGGAHPVRTARAGNDPPRSRDQRSRSFHGAARSAVEGSTKSSVSPRRRLSARAARRRCRDRPLCRRTRSPAASVRRQRLGGPCEVAAANRGGMRQRLGQPDAVVERFVLVVRTQQPRREAGLVQQAPGVVARVGEVRGRRPPETIPGLNPQKTTSRPGPRTSGSVPLAAGLRRALGAQPERLGAPMPRPRAPGARGTGTAPKR